MDKTQALSTETFSQYDKCKKHLFSLLFSIKIYTITTILNR